MNRLLRVLALVGLIAAALLPGCGGGSGSTSSTAPVSGDAATATVRAQFLLLRSVPANVASLRFLGLDAAGNVLYGPLTVPKAAQVELASVPVQVVRLLIEYLDAQGETVGFGSNPVTLAPGQTFTLDDPPFDDLTAALEALIVDPVSASAPRGRTRQFTARGVYADQTEVDLTSVVAWSSGTPAVATVSDHGLASAVGTGLATVTATYGGLSTNATLTVTNAELVGLQITPDPLVVPLGLGQQLTATGFFSDGSQQDLTGAVSWSSANPARATVDSGGQITTVAAGSVEITAQDTASGLSAQRTLVVTDAELASLAVTPADPSIADGTTQQFTATGTFSDGSQANLTSQVAWSSGTPACATIDAAGLATAVDPGTSAVQASLAGISGSTTLTVTAATLQSVAVTPEPLVLPAGTSQQLTATGTFSDGSSQDLTSQVTWTSGTPGNGTVDSAGLATAVLPGQSVLRATHPGTGIFGEVTLVVTAAVLQTVTVGPADLAVGVGDDYALTATGTYSDGSTLNLTSAAAWSSSAPGVLTVSSAGGATGVSAGTSDATATVQGVSGSLPVEVGTAPELFVSGTQGLTVSRFLFNLPGNGDLAPSSTKAPFLSPEGVWYDPTHGELWIGAQSSTRISVLDRASNSTVRTFDSASGDPRGVGYDAGRDLLYASTTGRQVDVYENPRSLNGGTPAPTRSLTGFGGSLYGLFLDAANDRLYVVRTSSGVAVLVFDNASTLSGDISTMSPRVIAAGLPAPRGLVVDTTRDILYVANDGGSVSLYANASTTDAPAGATATLSGGNTRLLSDTDGVAIDTHRDELYVATATGGNRICIFTGASALVGSNDIAPARELEGANFGVNGPGGMFLYLR